MSSVVENYYVTKFDSSAVTVEVAIFAIKDNELKILLTNRELESSDQLWKLPDSYLKLDVDLDSTAEKIVRDNLNVKRPRVHQIYTFGKEDRYPGKRVISVLYGCIISIEKLKDYKQTKFLSVYSLPELAFDHDKMINTALNWLKNEIEGSDTAFHFLKKEFTMSELQSVYEIVLQKDIDKRNFRKSVLTEGKIEATGKFEKGAHRPAELFRVSSKGK